MRKIFTAAIVALLVICSALPASADIAADLAPETNADGVQIAVSVEEERENIIDILEDATPEEVFLIRDKLEEAFLGVELEGLDGFGKFYKFVSDFKGLISSFLLLIGGALLLIASKILGKKIETNNNNVLAAFKGSTEMWEKAKKTVNGYTEATNAYLEESRRKDETISALVAELDAIQRERLDETKRMTVALNQSRDASVAALRGYIKMIEASPGLDEIYRKHFVQEAESVIEEIMTEEGGDGE